MKQIIIILTLLLAAGVNNTAFPTSTPVEADIVVALDGTGNFNSIQAALNAAPSNSERRTVIYIKRGLYKNEKLIVPPDKTNLTLIGESREGTIISYHIYDCAGGKCPAGDAALWTGDNILTSATLTILGDGFRAENMTIQNTAGPVGQAQAITVRADRCIFINVDFYGYQDTMYFWSDGKRSYFQGCLVVGRTDYIYGSGTVFFQSCEIRSWGGGWITAPSTARYQSYGFVFNECNITYATGSPRGGDDGVPVRFGRPWHEYPKVAWLRCNLTGMIHPEGWGDSWNMSYASTSTDLHLYEYKNTGPGADRSNRADWAGLREITDEEALEYTVQKVMAGSDGWDPTAEPPMVINYTWVGGSDKNGWLVAQNWNPEGIPGEGESATVDGDFTIVADGDTMQADLNLKNGSRLEVGATSTATYISVAAAQIRTSTNASFNGKIATKDSVLFSVDNELTLNAVLTGVHHLVKTGSGKLILNADNSDFSGQVRILEGALEATEDGSLGKSPVQVSSGAALVVGNNNSFHSGAMLEVFNGSHLELNADLTTSEFFIDGVMQSVGEYSAVTHPGLISGNGRIIVGRPKTFVFHRGDNGNWDNPEHYTPALFPLAGETVSVEEEMETTSTLYEANLVISGAGNLRLRGAHKSTGTIFMKTGTSFRYNTSGAGMSLDAPVTVEGDITLVMESGNATGSTMTLSGPFSGNSKVTALNNGKGTVNTGKVVLTGNNIGFDGTWDVTRYTSKYPGTPGYLTFLEGKSANAFGKGTINVGLGNRVIFSHSRAAGDSLVLNLADSAKAVLNTEITVNKFTLNGNPVPDGEYSADSHPALYEGTGKLIVGETDSIPDETGLPAFPGAEGHGKYTTGGRNGRVIYVTNLEDNNNPGSFRYAINQAGPRIILFKVSGTIQLKSRLNISNGDMTIAGQTAPGDGVTLRDYPVVVDADNVIIRFLRFRMGDKANQEGDALGGRYSKNIILDHCSMSWSTDECVSFYQNENFSLQWCIISESLRNSVHNKGAHGYGGIWGGKNASFHHNLLAHHDSRNPRLGETHGEAFALTDLVDLRNNVIYNWQGNSCYGGEAMNVNIVNCYYKPGPATTKVERIISIDKLTETGFPISNLWGKFYIAGNVMTGSARATSDNWTYGVCNQFNARYTVSQAEKEAMRLADPLNPGQVTTHLAEKAYEKIIEYGGASLKRDSVDLRIIHDVATGTATYLTGGNGSTGGIIDTQDAVGGWPLLESLVAPDDTDGDGMPDYWETEHGLLPDDPGDAILRSVDGVYTNIEVYINSLVANIISEQNKDAISTGMEAWKTEKEAIQLFFNTLSRELYVNHQDNIKTIAIYSISGQMLISRNFFSPSVNMQVAGLLNGIYIVRVTDERNRVFAQRIPVFTN